jgi:hypothetical protein
MIGGIIEDSDWWVERVLDGILPWRTSSALNRQGNGLAFIALDHSVV